MPWSTAFACCTLLLCLTALAPPTAAAQAERTGVSAARPAANGRAWTALSPAQRQVLEPLKDDWALIDGVRQQKWLELAVRYPRMSSEEQERVQERMAAWSRMSSKERGVARQQFQSFRLIDAEELRSSWDAYQSLAPEDRERLLEKAREQAPKASTTARTARPNAPTSPVKSSIVQTPPPPSTPLVSSTTVRAAPGATTSVITMTATPPRHQQVGLPKLAAQPGFVDSKTLLPKRGPQGAAVLSEPAASTPSRP